MFFLPCKNTHRNSTFYSKIQKPKNAFAPFWYCRDCCALPDACSGSLCREGLGCKSLWDDWGQKCLDVKFANWLRQCMLLTPSFCGLLPQLLDLNRPLNYDRCQHLIAWPQGCCHARSDNSWWLWCYLWHRLLLLLLQFVLSLADSGQATPQSFLQVQNPVKLVLQDQNPVKLGIQDVHPINHWN